MKLSRILTIVSGAVVTTLSTSTFALAADGAGGGQAGLVAIGAGLAMAGAVLGAALGQGRAVGAAMESIGRNPNSADRIQTPMILGLAFMEALGIFAFVIAIILTGKI